MDRKTIAIWLGATFAVGIVSSYAATWFWNRGRCRCTTTMR